LALAAGAGLVEYKQTSRIFHMKFQWISLVLHNLDKLRSTDLVLNLQLVRLVKPGRVNLEDPFVCVADHFLESVVHG
jgi:hypothetical protein